MPTRGRGRRSGRVVRGEGGVTQNCSNAQCGTGPRCQLRRERRRTLDHPSRIPVGSSQHHTLSSHPLNNNKPSGPPRELARQTAVARVRTCSMRSTSTSEEMPSHIADTALSAARSLIFDRRFNSKRERLSAEWPEIDTVARDTPRADLDVTACVDRRHWHCHSCTICHCHWH